MTKSTKSRRQSKSRKPDRPFEGFPLFPHATRRWAKKIRGHLHYFGPWDKPAEALERFNREWPYLSEGRTPPPVDTGDGCTMRLLCNAFLSSKQARVEAGELSPRSFRDYHHATDLLVAHFGKDRRVDDLRPDDFERFRSALARRNGPVSLRNEITRCRVVFKYAFDQRLIAHPINYGQSFNRPSAKALRRARNEAGIRMFEAAEIHRILKAADPVLKAMVLLSANTGFGNTDVATLPIGAVDLDNGWIDFPRPKTEIRRRVPLWPETIEALRKAIELRPDPKSKADADCLFLTAHGRRWVRVQKKKATGDATDAERMVPVDALSQRFARLLKSLDINGHRNFYALRHTFETVAGESRDQVAVNAVMGHVDSSMAGQYRERISDDRLRAAVNVVRQWLFGAENGREGNGR